MSVGRQELSVCQNNVAAFSCCCKVNNTMSRITGGTPIVKGLSIFLVSDSLALLDKDVSSVPENSYAKLYTNCQSSQLLIQYDPQLQRLDGVFPPQLQLVAFLSTKIGMNNSTPNLIAN